MIVPGSLDDWLQAALMTTLLGVAAARLGWVLLDGERLEPVPVRDAPEADPRRSGAGR
jgi:hypothetical protein